MWYHDTALEREWYPEHHRIRNPLFWIASAYGPGVSEEEPEFGYVFLQRRMQSIVQRLQATHLQLLGIYAVPLRGGQ
jgi:hypothetical protein